MRRLVLAAVATALLAGCGDDDAQPGRLGWSAEPIVFTPDGLPQDRVLTGKVRNDGERPVDLRVDQVRVLTGERTLESNVRFVEAFGHGLYGPGGPPAPLKASEYDQRRLGEIVRIEPGQAKPVTVAWRTAGAEASTVELGPFALDVPPAR